MESPGRYGDWLAPPPSPPRGSRSQSIRPARGKDFYLATSGDLYLATSRDIFMATDTREHRTRRCRRDGVTRMDRWGHGGATSGPRATGSQRTTPVNTGPPSAEVSGQTPPPAAGRHDPPEIS